MTVSSGAIAAVVAEGGEPHRQDFGQRSVRLQPGRKPVHAVLHPECHRHADLAGSRGVKVRRQQGCKRSGWRCAARPQRQRQQGLPWGSLTASAAASGSPLAAARYRPRHLHQCSHARKIVQTLARFSGGQRAVVCAPRLAHRSCPPNLAYITSVPSAKGSRPSTAITSATLMAATGADDVGAL